jgi:transposase
LVRRGAAVEFAAMPIAPEGWPDDAAALRAMLATQAEEMAGQKRRLEEIEAERDAHHAELLAARAGLIEQRYEIEALRARLARALRVAFGRSSEKLRDRVEQLELTLADINELLGETATIAVETAIAPEPPDEPSKPTRPPLPEALPRDIVEHSAPCACPECGGPLRPLGEDVTEILDYVPGSFRVTRHVRPKLSCRGCETIAQAPAPSLPVPRGRAGPGLLAHVLVAKYCDHLPLHRQAEIYAREDIDLSRSTLADMVGQMARLVRPLVDAVSRHVIAGERVHADDTVVPVLAPGLGKTRTARLWTYVRDDRPFAGSAPPAVLYRYSPDRKGEHPRAHLQDFRGILQADGYAGFAGLYAAGGVVEAACLAHVRRKFWDVHETTRSPIAREALDRIAALYRIEDTIRGRPPDQRLRTRCEHTAPLMAELRHWLDATLPRIPGRSELAKAIRYALSRWEALKLILADGRACTDNSAAERAMRPITLGRRNWTFAGSDSGGERAAAIYSLTETAKINGLDPEDYLRRLISRIADHPVNRVAELLPWNLAGTRLRLSQRPAA